MIRIFTIIIILLQLINCCHTTAAIYYVTKATFMRLRRRVTSAHLDCGSSLAVCV
jgi:hypothetical protein